MAKPVIHISELILNLEQLKESSMIRNLVLLAVGHCMLLPAALAQSIVCPLPSPGGNQITFACSSIKDKIVTLGLKHSRMLFNGSCVNVLTLDLDQPGLEIATHGASEE